GYGLRSRYAGADADRLFEGVKPLFEGAGLVFGNLETVLSLSGLDPTSLSSAQMRGDPSFAGLLRRTGFDVVSVANNHAVQHGVAAFEETVALLREVGITPCGLRGTAPWGSEPAVLTREGARIGFLGYCLRPRQYGRDEPPFAEGTPFEILADVRRLRPTVDHVVVSLHWGEEFVPTPSAAEVTLGRSIVDAGAALVLGHHPHVVRPVERHRGGVVAYSLGNFAADMIWQRRLREGVVLRCTLGPGGVADVQVTPTLIGGDFRPAVAGPARSPADALPGGMPEPEYRRAVARSVRAQQLASYAYALANARRYPRPILVQLLTRTLRNKIAGLLPSRAAGG
ncbi:MAG TPA: CapA family protein, partial [Longimicrobiaceae bacterium]|nr:CapA family protein [Longimicrobiaceae bacterium]